MGATAAQNPPKGRGFIYVDTPEPHALRKIEILKKYPEISELMGYEWKTKYLVAATVALQVFMAWLTLHWSWPSLLLAVYVVGATATHSLFLAIHELSHNCGASTTSRNLLIAFLANLPVAIPYCVTFKPYHLSHHKNQGTAMGSKEQWKELDADIPTCLEAYLISGSAFGYVDHCIRKTIFLLLQIFVYAFRPMMVRPDMMPYGDKYVANWLVVLSFDGVMIAWLGPQVMLYFLLSAFFAGSIHPTAGHFLAEHYVVDGKAETYSYYGPLNRLAYNVGYHNEHHDFPNIPWSRLPRVRQIAPEFYDSLPQCESWPGLLVRFIFDDSISLYSRVRRVQKAE